MNCSSKYYEELWNNNIANYKDDQWLCESELLSKDCFTRLSRQWSAAKAYLSDYERHQLFLELDILVAKQLGITLEELIEIYMTYFLILWHQKIRWHMIVQVKLFTLLTELIVQSLI